MLGERLFPVVKEKRERKWEMGQGSRRKAREKEEEREFGIRAGKRAIMKELSLVSHEKDDFSLIV